MNKCSSRVSCICRMEWYLDGVGAFGGAGGEWKWARVGVGGRERRVSSASAVSVVAVEVLAIDGPKARTFEIDEFVSLFYGLGLTHAFFR